MLRRCGTWAGLWLLCGAILGAGSFASAAEPSKKPLKPGQFNPANDTVDLFEAIKAKQVEVKVIHKDSSGGKLLFTNKTEQGINLKLPDAFAAVHVLAQIGGGMSGGVGGGMAQASGGGMGGGGGGMGGGGMGGGGGMFNIAPERVGELKFVSVCLEHGKPEPRASLNYEIRPIETVAPKPEVAEVLRMLDRGVIPQRVAQVLAWHLNNEMSFEELAAKQIKPIVGPSYPYFSLAEIRAAMQVKEHVAKQLEERAKTGETPVLPKL